jgi:hypothetical protein
LQNEDLALLLEELALSPIELYAMGKNAKSFGKSAHISDFTSNRRNRLYV